jgi:hypothetical protein
VDEFIVTEDWNIGRHVLMEKLEAKAWSRGGVLEQCR